MAKRKASGGAGKALVIVESPAKARTINKYLGSRFVVKASLGHVRDLPKSTFGIDLTDNFKPTYEIVRGRAKVVAELRKAADKSREVFLATDRDREGEAIAWHLVEALNLPSAKTRRVIFNEITKSAIAEAFENPHEIDLDRVNAQQARRILDRIVGYELSPLLWRKIAKGLSAGRVQSVAVRLIVDREREIRDFQPEEYWVVAPVFACNPSNASALNAAWQRFLADDSFGSEGPSAEQRGAWLVEHHCFRTELIEFPEGRPFHPSGKLYLLPDGSWSFESAMDEAVEVAKLLGCDTVEASRKPRKEYPHFNQVTIVLRGALEYGRVPEFVVDRLETKRRTTKPPAPFTTATLQQQAASVLRFSASRTMRIAQQLYEGIDVNGEGAVGLITYMRTDSTNLAAEAVAHVRDFIKQDYGERYLPKKSNVFGKRQARAQEAHEAVRPTDPTLTPDRVRHALTDEQFKLYQLIWKRFVACQMPPAEWDTTTARIAADTPAGRALFKASGRKLVFDGFMKVAGVTSDDQILPALREGQPVAPVELVPIQKYTLPPPRYTEASLVRALETDGIGRPSTYAAIIETVQKRGYVEQVERKFHSTPLGEVVTDKLVRHFPRLMDVKFTSHMEDELDKIEDAHLDWIHVLREFYDPFRDLLARAGEEMEATRSQPSEYDCPLCASPMVYRWSKTGRFLSCSKYPDCRGMLRVNRNGEAIRPETAEQKCESCGKPLVLRQSRSGFFLGCSGYPDCRNTVPCDENGRPLKAVAEEDLTQPCNACGKGLLVVRWKGRRAFLGCDRYPSCKNAAPIPEGLQVKKKPAPPPEAAGIVCEECKLPMVIRTGRRGKFIACSGFPKCRNTKPIEKLEALRAAAAHHRDEGAVSENASSAPPQQAAEASPPSWNGRRPQSARAAASKQTNKLGEPPPGYAWTRTGRPVVEVTPEDGTLVCPECGHTMVLRRGRFGPFFSCKAFPNCKFVSNLRGEAKKSAEELLPAPAKPKPIPTDIACEECGAPMLVRQGPRGKFLGCSRYPKCKATRQLPEGFAVPAASEKG